MKTTQSFDAISAREFSALPEPEDGDQLLGPLVARGGRTVIAGASGHGKSTLALAIVAAIVKGRIVKGGSFLGYVGAGVGPALITDLEQGQRSIKRALREAGLAERDDVFVVRVPDGLALDSDDGDLDAVERLIAEHKPAVVIVDPYYKAHTADANEERAVTDLMRRLDGLRDRHGFALILPAHVRKEQASSGPRKLTLDDVSGSGAATRGAEVVLGIERIAHGFSRLRFLKDRDGDLPVGDALDLTYSKEHGFRVKEAEDIEAKAREHADDQWRTVKEWAALLGIREKGTKDLLGRLVEAGEATFEIGPEGRSQVANCWQIHCAHPTGAPGRTTAPTGTLATTAPTAPPSIEEGDSGRSHTSPTDCTRSTGAPTLKEREADSFTDAVASLYRSAATAEQIGDTAFGTALRQTAFHFDHLAHRLAPAAVIEATASSLVLSDGPIGEDAARAHKADTEPEIDALAVEVARERSTP